MSNYKYDYAVLTAHIEENDQTVEKLNVLKEIFPSLHLGVTVTDRHALRKEYSDIMIMKECRTITGADMPLLVEYDSGDYPYPEGTPDEYKSVAARPHTDVDDAYILRIPVKALTTKTKQKKNRAEFLINNNILRVIDALFGNEVIIADVIVGSNELPFSACKKKIVR